MHPKYSLCLIQLILEFSDFAIVLGLESGELSSNLGELLLSLVRSLRLLLRPSLRFLKLDLQLRLTGLEMRVRLHKESESS